MENVTEALYMAFAVLAFVLALSVSIITFGQVKVAAQGILDARDKEASYTYIDYTNEDTTRMVTREDIIPTLYRAYKENYIVRIEGANLTDNLYQVKVIEEDPTTGLKTTKYEPTSNIDLENESIGTQADANTFVNALLQGKLAFESLDEVRFSYFGDYLQSDSLYDILGGGRTFEEKLGVYYQEDEGENGPNENLDEVNKTEKRVITYILQ